MKKINVSELLKDCPSGMELDCTMYDDVYFDWVDELNIIHCYIQYETHKTSITFNQYGTPNSDMKSKCVIFPKGKTNWEGFHRPFKYGDIIYICDEYSDATFTYVAILKQIEKGGHIYSLCFYNYEDDEFSTDDYLYDVYRIRFATEEEKQKLFKKIKEHGYNWDNVTKVLYKIVEPKFKIGDIIKDKCNLKWKVINENSHYYEISLVLTGTSKLIEIKAQDDYELVPVEQKFKVGDKIRLKENHNYIYTITGIREKENKYECGVTFVLRFSEQGNWELVPKRFDINTLKPFESKVLVRTKHFHDKWTSGFFSHIDSDDGFAPFWTTADKNYQQCIPYEGNEHLLGKTDDCDEYFKV